MKMINLERIKQLLAENGMDVKAMAKAANINLRSAKGIMDGSISRPTKSTVTRLADAFGVKADTLVIDVEREAKQPAPPEPEKAAEEICNTAAPEAPAPEKERPDIAADEPAAVDSAGAYYIRPDFILVNKSVYNDIQPTLISTASISSINIDMRNPKIWIRRSIGSDKDEVMVEVFDDFDARDERWEELMEFFKTRGILG